MIKNESRNELRKIRHARVRNKVFGTSACPRLNVFRSNSQIYAQIIDDEKGTTLVSSSSVELKIKNGGNIEGAKLVGKDIATKAKKAIAGFKVRAGQAIGCKVTLRGENMYNFLDKLISITLPRVRDFRGVSPKAFDGRGNYTMGLNEQLIFSEIEYDNVVKVRGMDIVFVTTAKTNEEAYDLLKGFGMPFKK